VAVCGVLPKVTGPSDPHVRPEGVDAETARDTMPVKLFRAFTVIVEVPDAAARICVGLTGPAETEKSGAAVTWKVMFAVV